jgi:purine-binding chemotaxis protein CheW
MNDGVSDINDAARGVLESRARALAVPIDAHATVDAIEVVCVQIAKQRYALEAAQVREVFRLADLAQLPGAQPPVFGVTVWRGDLLLLLDLRRALGLSSTALNDLRHVVVLGGRTTPVAILVDEVEGMQTIRATDVRPTTGRNGAAREFVRGVTSEALIVLETNALLRVLD